MRDLSGSGGTSKYGKTHMIVSRSVSNYAKRRLRTIGSVYGDCMYSIMYSIVVAEDTTEERRESPPPCTTELPVIEISL